MDRASKKRRMGGESMGWTVDGWGEIRFCIACVGGACQVHFLVFCRVAELGVNEKDLNILSFGLLCLNG